MRSWYGRHTEAGVAVGTPLGSQRSYGRSLIPIAVAERGVIQRPHPDIQRPHGDLLGLLGRHGRSIIAVLRDGAISKIAYTDDLFLTVIQN